MVSANKNLRQKKFKACMICSALNPVRNRNIDDDKVGIHSGRKQHENEKCLNCNSINSFSMNYKGLISVTSRGGWVEKWQRLQNKGLYAMIIDGAPNEDDIIEYEANGNTYYDRNNSFRLQ